MERKIVGLIAVSTLMVGILLWSKKDAEKPAPTYVPTIAVGTACYVQAELWCQDTLPVGATSKERDECAKEYSPRCTSCLHAVQHGRRPPGRHQLPDECQPLKHWKKNHP